VKPLRVSCRLTTVHYLLVIIGYFWNASVHLSNNSANLTQCILVVDDSALIREAAKIALSTIGGWRTITASGGEEGIERAVSERFDAILLDVEMPGIDGIAVAERLQAIPATSTLPIVLLSAHEHIEESPLLRGVSVAGAIAKPFDMSDLARQMATLLGWPV
jgi:two-component system alkaline phosphatase synthesis response regulator PhoP